MSKESHSGIWTAHSEGVARNSCKTPSRGMLNLGIGEYNRELQKEGDNVTKSHLSNVLQLKSSSTS